MTVPVYLDHNATSPVVPAAVAAMVEAMQMLWANPSSTHGPGQAARRLLATARAQIAAFVGALPAELVFTSGATEANCHAVLGALHAARARGRTRYALTAVEHPALRALAARLEAEGTPVDRLPVDGDGRVDLAAARALLGRETAVLSVMGANNETGVLMPPEIVAIGREQGALVHVDATQLLGKSAWSFRDCGADLATMSAHKLGGPKGIGALLVRKGVEVAPLIDGRQERHRRGGTENVPGIAGFAAACLHAAATLQHDLATMRLLRDRLEQALVSALPAVRVFGGAAPRVPNTSCLAFGTVPADAVLAGLERAGVVASSGSACSAGGTEPSPVLCAMGVGDALARAAVRFSLGRETSAADVERATAAAVAALAPLLADTAVCA